MLTKIRHSKILKTTATILALAGMVLLTGCGKNSTFQEGAGTNYPFSWKQKSNGQILVTLNGSYTPDYTWTAVSEDESVAVVEVKKEEKNSIVKYLITPMAEGRTTVTFIRMNDTGEESEYTKETPAPVEDEDSSEAEVEGNKAGEPASADDASGAEENPSEVYYGEGYDPSRAFYYERLTAKDKVCEISMDIEVSLEKKKLKAVGYYTGTTETEGLTKGGDDEVTFSSWKEDDNILYVRLADMEGDWTVRTEGKYAGAPEAEVDENGEPIIGIVPDVPAKDEAGNDIIVSAYHFGYYASDSVFCIQGLYPGTAVVRISSVSLKKMYVVNLTIQEGGYLTVESEEIEAYTPTKEELEILNAPKTPDDEEEESEELENPDEGNEEADNPEQN